MGGIPFKVLDQTALPFPVIRHITPEDFPGGPALLFRCVAVF
jgi:hypothetical protein